MKKILTTLLLLGLAIPAFAALDANTIVKKAEKAAYYQGKDGRAKITMKMSDGRSRQFIILRKNAGENQKFYVYFKRPSDVRKTTFLVHKNKKGNDDRWMYLPALDLIKRIAAGDKRTSFMGSHFFYEDVSGRNPNEDTHELIKESKKYYVIKSTPKDPKNVEFKYYTTWIHKNSFIPTKTSYFNAKGKEYRQYQAKKVEKVGPYLTVTAAVMKDLESEDSTELTYSDVSYNQGFKDAIFTERYLKSPPRKWL